MPSVGQKCPPHVAFVEQLCRAMSVVNRQHKSAFDASANFPDPVASFEPRFRVLAFLQHYSLRGKIFVDRARRDPRHHIHKFSVVPANKDFLQRAFSHHHAVHRQRIHQFIREDAARRNLCGNLRRNPQMSLGRVPLQSHRCLLEPRRRPFYRNVTQRIVKPRQLRFARIQDVLRQPPHSGPCFHQPKFFRTRELPPHPRKFPRQQPAENRMHVHVGVIIGKPLRFRFAVIAVHRMVQAFAHEIGKRDGAVAANAFREQFFERRHAPFVPAVPEEISAWSFFHMRSKISFAASSNSTKCMVSSEVSPRRCSAASRNMILAHSSNGNPATPVPTAGNAIVFKPRSFAIRRQCAVELRSASAVVPPPRRMLAAWMTNLAFSFPPLVIAAYPTGMVPISLHSRWMASPPFRRIAPATPPPRIKSLFAALTMTSVSISVRSPCWMTILSASDFISGTLFSAYEQAPKSYANCYSFQKLFVRFFVKTKNHLRTAHHNGPANQIGFLGHQLDRFRARRRMF